MAWKGEAPGVAGHTEQIPWYLTCLVGWPRPTVVTVDLGKWRKGLRVFHSHIPREAFWRDIFSCLYSWISISAATTGHGGAQPYCQYAAPLVLFYRITFATTV